MVVPLIAEPSSVQLQLLAVAAAGLLVAVMVVVWPGVNDKSGDDIVTTGNAFTVSIAAVEVVLPAHGAAVII